MTAKVHRALTAILASLGGVSAILAATDPASLGVDATSWAWAAVLLNVGVIVVTAARQAFESTAP